MASTGMFFGGSGGGSSLAVSAPTTLSTLPKSSIFKTPTSGSFLSGAGSIYSGISAYRESKSLASDLRLQGEVVFAESVRTANIIIEEGTKFAAAQSLEYIGSGVQIAGSAVVTLAQTKKYASTEASAVRAKGAAQKQLAQRTAKRKESEGRAALVSGILGGVASVFI